MSVELRCHVSDTGEAGASREAADCGICGHPLHDRHRSGDAAHPATRAGRRVEYVVAGLRGAFANCQEVGNPSKTFRTMASGLAQELGVDEASIVGQHFSYWVEPAEYGVVRSDLQLVCAESGVAEQW